MGKVFLLCGLTGSGKTRWAKAQEERGAMRLSTDEWMIELFGHHMPRELFNARLDACLGLQMELASRLAKRGLDVVLDHGFWKLESRNKARQYFAEHGLASEVIYFKADLETLRERLKARNRDLPPGTFDITEEMLEMFSGWFEEPGPEEDARVVN